ncbi:probable disease resistance RPP8-like protein 4 [Lycium ferocissimum]|uniref:probable disease resistance RPP8-like protein 4 n=1 Tax=Lycium ferocissimum TaxID=112874 RepID=UPI002814F258|nr:probable disease resistance RPP8-like protein 4 [Lycium ferocissimum]
MAESAVTFLVRRLSTLLNGGQKFLEGIQQEIVYIRDEFEKMRAFSRIADAKEEDDDDVQAWIKQVEDLVHDVQDILEKHVVIMCNNFQEKGPWSWKKSHHSSMSEKLFEAQNDNILMMLEGVNARTIVISQGQETFLEKYDVITSNTWCNNHEEVVLDDDADLVGVENHKSALVDWLLSDDPKWKLHCVVGTRGIGKTALVEKIFHDPEVNKNFSHAIWFEILRFTNLEELMMSFIDLKNDSTSRAIEAMDANTLAQRVQQFFESTRYLVVLDDVPDIATWRTLKCLFPIKIRGCRVITIKT